MQRHITCAEVLLKLLERVLKNRIDEKINSSNFLRMEQGGFCTGRGTYELFYILRCTLEEELSRSGKIYLAFLDLKSAFDRVNHNLLLCKYYDDLKIDKGIWILLHDLLQNFKVSVK